MSATKEFFVSLIHLKNGLRPLWLVKIARTTLVTNIKTYIFICMNLFGLNSVI